MQWLKNRKTIEQLLEKPYGQYVITLFVLTLFLHQLNIYVFNRIEESNVIGDVQFFRFFINFIFCTLDVVFFFHDFFLKKVVKI